MAVPGLSFWVLLTTRFLPSLDGGRVGRYPLSGGHHLRRGARVAEWARLETECARKGTPGSNPGLSATSRRSIKCWPPTHTARQTHGHPLMVRGEELSMASPELLRDKVCVTGTAGVRVVRNSPVGSPTSHVERRSTEALGNPAAQAWCERESYKTTNSLRKTWGRIK